MALKFVSANMTHFGLQLYFQHCQVRILFESVYYCKYILEYTYFIFDTENTALRTNHILYIDPGLFQTLCYLVCFSQIWFLPYLLPKN